MVPSSHKLLVDTNVWLADFFVRYPEFGNRNGLVGDEKQKLDEAREKIHDALEWVAQNGIVPHIAAFSLYRLLTIFSDMGTPAHIIADEIAYLKSQASIVETPSEHLNTILELVNEEKSHGNPDPELELLTRTARKAGCGVLLTLTPRFPKVEHGVFILHPWQVSQFWHEPSA